MSSHRQVCCARLGPPNGSALWEMVRLGLVLVVFASAGARADDGRAAFAAATALEARGEFTAAADALERLGHADAGGAFAADALFEAAAVAEEHLAAPARAHRLYEEVAARYPENRLARRARTRADVLGRALATGEAPLVRYQKILAAQSIDEMARFVDAEPGFALADRALYWLGGRLADAHRDAEAEARFAAVERRFPASEWAARAKRARADLLLGRGRFFAARALYRELAAAPDAEARTAGREGEKRARSVLGRALLSLACALYLAIFAGARARALTSLRPIPLELYYYLPVAALFVAAALTENRAIGWATSAIALAGAALVWLTALGLRGHAPLSLRARLGHALAITLAVVAIVFLALQATGLTDLVLETLRAGAERD